MASCGSPSSLATLCTTAYLAPLFAGFTALETVVFHQPNLTATLVSNYTNTAGGGPMWPEYTGLSFCNVSITYGHINLQDSVRFALFSSLPLVLFCIAGSW